MRFPMKKCIRKWCKFILIKLKCKNVVKFNVHINSVFSYRVTIYMSELQVTIYVCINCTEGGTKLWLTRQIQQHGGPQLSELAGW